MSIWLALVLMASIKLAPLGTTVLTITLAPNRHYLLIKDSEESWTAHYRNNPFVLTLDGDVGITVTGLTPQPAFFTLAPMLGDKPDWAQFTSYKDDKGELQIVDRDLAGMKIITRQEFNGKQQELEYNVTYLRSASAPRKQREDTLTSPEERIRGLRLAGGDLSQARNEIERFYALNKATRQTFASGNLEEAAKLADELAQLAKKYSKGWNYGNAIQDSNQVLGLIALQQGDLVQARKSLLASANSDGSPQMNSFGPNLQLAKELLDRGEKDVVLEYFTLCRRFWKMGQQKLDDWANDIREGRVPDFRANLLY